MNEGNRRFRLCLETKIQIQMRQAPSIFFSTNWFHPSQLQLDYFMYSFEEGIYASTNSPFSPEVIKKVDRGLELGKGLKMAQN